MTYEIKENQYGLDEEQIISQIRREYQQGLDSVTTKRRLRENDLQKLYVPTTKKDKVEINVIYTTMQTLMSVYYTDRMVVNFQGRKQSSNETAANLNKIAEFDYDEMDLEQVDYQWNWDRFFFGVGIKILDGRNDKTNTPIARTFTPLSWIPDPRGGFSMESHRWAGFEVEDTLGNLRANKNYYNIDLINSETEGEQEQIRLAYTQGRSIIDQGYEQVENKKYGIYHHYTIIDGYKYLVTLANNKTLIIRMIKLEPITKEEKENPLKVPFPIALKYYSPVKGDPFGISIPDLLRDKQSAESKLFNLALIKETRGALGQDIYYNPKVIKNSKLITSPSINPKAIPANVRDGDQIAGAVYRLPKEENSNNAFNVGGQLHFQNSLSTGIDANSLGIQGDGNQTATEAQITQKNANLRFILGTKIGKWGEATFWRLWKRAYEFNMTPRSKKILYITQSFGSQYFEFRKRDFLSNEDYDIKIISSSEKESLMNKQKGDFFAIAPQLLSDPTVPEISKRYIKKKMLRLSNLSEDEINIMMPKTIDEMNAELDVELLNNGEDIEEPKTGQDHLTYIYIYLSATDSSKKYEAIEKRKSMYIQEGGMKAQIEQAMAMGQDNTMGNIAASNASQQSASRVQQEIGGVSGNLNAAGV